MQRFKIGDPVLILPKFAHLYPTESGTVVLVESDPFRPIFNEYTIEFPNGSRAHLFEFQLLESDPNYETLIAVLVFDSNRQPALTDMRGLRAGRQIVLRTRLIDIDIRIQSTKSRASIVGQVLEQ